MTFNALFKRLSFEISNRGLARVHFDSRNRSQNKSPVVKDAQRRLAKYFDTGKDRFEKIQFDLSGLSSFQRKVLTTLMRIPAGSVVSYGELAKRAGYRNAARAVGTVMRLNPLPILIPCHRVIRSDGKLGKYALGAHWKKRLLEHEKVFLSPQA